MNICAGIGGTTCAACSAPAGPFAVVIAGHRAALCAGCAARLLRGEPKSRVLNGGKGGKS